MKKITADRVETIAKKLRQMPAATKQPEYSAKEAVALLESEIGAMKERGYSLAQIAKTLRAEGLSVDAVELKRYLRDAPATTKKPAARAEGAATKKPAARAERGATKAARTPAKSAVKKRAAEALRAAKTLAKRVSKSVPAATTVAKRAGKSALERARVAEAVKAKRGASRAMFEIKPDTDDI